MDCQSLSSYQESLRNGALATLQPMCALTYRYQVAWVNLLLAHCACGTPKQVFGDYEGRSREINEEESPRRSESDEGKMGMPADRAGVGALRGLRLRNAGLAVRIYSHT